jgi:hypothetical protein
LLDNDGKSHADVENESGREREGKEEDKNRDAKSWKDFTLLATLFIFQVTFWTGR